MPSPLRSLLLVVALSACAAVDPTTELTENPYTGCYDATCVAAPVLVAGVPPLASLATLLDHTCGLTAAGEAWCWGDNRTGQLGDGTDQRRTTPVRVAGEVRFASISAGSGFTCGLALDRTAYCWGSSATSQLAQPGPERCYNGAVQCARTPLALPGRWTAITTGMRHACALDEGGAAFCWGFNVLGETGSAAFFETVTAPFKVPGGLAFTSIAAGDAFTCALTAEGRAYCWGSANRGELGAAGVPCGSVAGFIHICSAVPLATNSAARFVKLTLSNGHACGLTSAGVAHCWGDNGQGQLGTGGFEYVPGPTVAQGGMSFATLNASGAVTCGTPAAGPSVCWGLNLFGKLGIDSRLELSVTPLPIAGNRRFAAFAGGQYHVCALTDTGATYCWGQVP